jgi:hypothetical protein
MSASRIAVASGAAGPVKVTTLDLEFLRDTLNITKKLCNRYPTTEEGLTVFRTIPPDWKCLESHPMSKELKFTRLFKTGLDGWGHKYRYTSDGKNYRIEASHGYFITDKSPKRSEGGYWENPHPLPPDPEPEIKDTFPGI